jgi:hypothetical protein
MWRYFPASANIMRYWLDFLKAKAAPQIRFLIAQQCSTSMSWKIRTLMHCKMLRNLQRELI